MGMSHIPAPTENYVSLVTLNPLLQPLSEPLNGSDSAASNESDMQTSHQSAALIPHQTFHSTYAQFPEEQAVIILPSSHTVVPTVKNNGLHQEQQPQQLLLLDLPDTNQSILQTASVVQIQPATRLSLIQTSTPQISLLQTQPSLELLHFPNTILLTEAEQPLLLCLQSNSQSQAVDQPFEGQTLVLNELIHTSITDPSVNQVALAKSWHNDSDLVNRALVALTRQPSQPASATSNALALQPQQQNRSSCHRNNCDKEDRFLREA